MVLSERQDSRDQRSRESKSAKDGAVCLLKSRGRGKAGGFGEPSRPRPGALVSKCLLHLYGQPRGRGSPLGASMQLTGGHHAPGAAPVAGPARDPGLCHQEAWAVLRSVGLTGTGEGPV